MPYKCYLIFSPETVYEIHSFILLSPVKHSHICTWYQLLGISWSRVHSTYIYYIVFTGCLVVCVDCRKLVLASKREPSCKLHEILKTCVKCSTAQSS
jgi:hypothetical protein